MLPQISHFHKNLNFSSILQLFRPTASSLYYGRDMSWILFFIFASCEPLIMLINVWLPIAMRVKVKEKIADFFPSQNKID